MSVKETLATIEEEVGEKLAKTDTFKRTGEKMEKDGRATRDAERVKEGKGVIPQAPGTGFKDTK